MRIAFNPSTVAALITPPNNKDITFDLRGQNIFARGVKFCGTDTNTWRDIKINNVSIDSNTLDLRDGDNTTLTNINGIVTINSTWRPVVNNLTSDSTTSSLSANQGRVLKALIDGKSDSEHNHDGRYVYNYGGAQMDGASINKNALGMSTTSGITKDWWHILQAAWNDEYRWNSQIAFPTQNRNGMYYRSGLDDNTAWGSWVKLLDVNNYSSTLDSRYYTESEVNKLLTNYYPITGGNMSGDNRWIGSTMGGGSDYWRIGGSGRGDTGTCIITIGDNYEDKFAVEIADWQGSISRPLEAIYTGINTLNIYTNGTYRQLYSNSANGSTIHSILNYSSSPYGLLTRIYNDGCVSLQSQRESSNSEVFSLSLNPLGGNVGIGTTSPSMKLHVNGDGIYLNSTATCGINMYSSHSESSISYKSNGGVRTVFGTYANTNRTFLWNESIGEHVSILSSNGYFGIGTTNPSSKLTVNGNISLFNVGSIRDLTIGGGIYWNPYVESTTDGSDAASITVVKSGVAGGTTLVLSQMNDTGDTIQFQTNGSARLYHNSYPILTTQNTYVSNNKGYINGTEITQVNNADTVDGEHANNFSYTHQKSFDFSKSKSGRIVTFDESKTNYGWINGFASTHNNQLTSIIFNTHRTSNWYVGYIEANISTGVTKGLTAVKQLAFLDSKVADSDKLDGYHASGLLTSVTNTNNGISVTVGGTTKSVSNISVNYASNAGNADTTDGVHITWAGELTSTNHLVAWEANGSALRDINPYNVSVGYASSAGNADTAQYLRSLGNQNCQTGRTQNYGDVYTYNTYAGNTGSPTTFSSVIGFGRGIAGTVEIAGGWWNSHLYWRSLRDCCDDWCSWRVVLDSSNYTEFINNYYWANVKISTSSSTTTSPTVHTLTATRVCAGHNPEIDNSISCSNWFRSSGATGWYNTTYKGGWYMSDTSWIRAHNGVGIYTSGQIYSSSSIRMDNISLEHTNEINSASGLHLNYRTSNNVTLCIGGGNVGISNSSPSYKLDVNGQVRASGFHHESVNSDNYILLAGGGYSKGVPVKYWAIYQIYIGGSQADAYYTKRSGNHDFITSYNWLSVRLVTLQITFPSGYSKNNTLIFGNGDHRTIHNWTTPVYVTIITDNDFGPESLIGVMLSSGSSFDTGYANIYFMCMG